MEPPCAGHCFGQPLGPAQYQRDHGGRNRGSCQGRERSGQRHAGATMAGCEAPRVPAVASGALHPLLTAKAAKTPIPGPRRPNLRRFVFFFINIIILANHPTRRNRAEIATAPQAGSLAPTRLLLLWHNMRKTGSSPFPLRLASRTCALAQWDATSRRLEKVPMAGAKGCKSLPILSVRGETP